MLVVIYFLEARLQVMSFAMFDITCVSLNSESLFLKLEEPLVIV